MSGHSCIQPAYPPVLYQTKTTENTETYIHSINQNIDIENNDDRKCRDTQSVRIDAVCLKWSVNRSTPLSILYIVFSIIKTCFLFFVFLGELKRYYLVNSGTIYLQVGVVLTVNG